MSGTQFAGIGVQFGAVILVFTLAGYWLDKKLGTSPWLLLVCVFVGAAAGFYSMYHKVTSAQRNDAQRLSESAGDSPADSRVDRRP